MNQESRPAPRIWKTLGRGLRKRCPHCGQGELFRKWFTLHSRCPVCGLVLETSPGDTWGFWVIGDRIFLGAAMVALYFGLRPESWLWRGFFLTAITVPLVYTMPHRKGVGVALDYLSRVYWGNPDEEIPSLESDRDD